MEPSSGTIDPLCVYVEPLCEPLWSYVEPLSLEPEPERVEPWETWLPGFGPAAPKHPEALLADPRPFKLLGKKGTRLFDGYAA